MVEWNSLKEDGRKVTFSFSNGHITVSDPEVGKKITLVAALGDYQVWKAASFQTWSGRFGDPNYSPVTYYLVKTNGIEAEILYNCIPGHRLNSNPVLDKFSEITNEKT